MRKSFFARYSLVILMAFAFATPFLMMGAQRAVRSNTNKVADWLPQTFTETKQLRWFRQHFVADQFVVVSWPGCELGGEPGMPDAAPDDPRIERLAKYLVPNRKSRQAVGVAVKGAPDHTRYFQSVTTARRTLNELTTEPSDVPYNLAVKRLQGTLIGPDGKQTCVVLMLSDEAIKDFRAVVGRRVPNGPLPWNREPGVLMNALKECGIDTAAARLGGPPVENVAIDEEGERTLARLALLSGALGLGLAWWSLRSIRLTLIVFACGILSAAAGLAIVNWTGQTTDAVMMCMPSMVYVLAISGAVHLVNYYRDAVHEHGLDGAPERAIAHGWKPAFLCNVTTGIGMASLATADLEPIRKFGIYAAAGVAAMLIFLFLFLPAALQLWPIRARRHNDSKHLADHPDGLKGLGEGTIWYEEYWSRTSNWIIRHHVAVATACFLFIGVMGLGLTQIKTNIDLLKLFDDKVQVRRDYAWLEDHLGRLVPMEVVVRFPADKLRSADTQVNSQEASLTYSYLERLEFVWLVQQTIDKELGPHGRNLVGPSLSAVTFAPPLPTGTDSWSLARRSVTNKGLEDSHAALSRSGYLTVDDTDGSELWRISLRAAAFANLDYGAFVDSVRAVIEPVLAAQRLREHVLQQISSSREDHSIAGASVCIWEGAAPQDAKDAPTDARSTKQQQRIFTSAAQQLLGKARLRLAAADATKINLDTMNNSERADAINQFKTFDCVVAVGDISDAEIATLADAGVRVVDSRRMVDRLSGDPRPPSDRAIYAVYTGVVPIVYKAQRALLDSLIESSFWSFVTITPLMMLVCWSIAGGAVVMLPNVLPVLVVFGGMGWLGIAIDIGSMMSASIALGVAVDDTIHFLTWYREALRKLGDRKAAIVSAYGKAGPPALQAALISGLSLSVFAFSTFTPTQRLGWLMMTILVCGVFAELVMMPAILAGPLGKAFPVRRPPAPAPVPMPHAPKRRASLVTSQT